MSLPIILANTFLLVALNQLFNIASRLPPERNIYNIGLWLAMASLMYSVYVLMLIAFISGINILRSYRIKELKILILGFITPYFLSGVYFFWNDRLDVFLLGLIDDLGLFSVHSSSGGVYEVGLLILVMILVISVSLSSSKIMVKKTNVKQNYFKAIYWILLVCFFMLLVKRNVTIHHLAILIVPLSILLSELMIVSKPSASKLFINIFLLLIIALQFKNDLVRLLVE
ncbi:MAG: hypothetical protein KJP00_02195 [Bacteroidia bacterium]|nr:hypothetical protein [Bacteroidia bacterium]